MKKIIIPKSRIFLDDDVLSHERIANKEMSDTEDLVDGEFPVDLIPGWWRKGERRKKQ